MIIFLAILVFLMAYKFKFAGAKFYDDYVSRESTLCINGFFITYILLSHTFAISAQSNIFNDSFNYIRIYLGQFPVAPFFFFSGFGILESIKHKKDYIKNFPKQRLLSFYVKFFILSLLYVVLNLFLRQYSLSTVLLSFTGFKSIGCGGWYIGAILVVYILVIIFFNLFKEKLFLPVLSITVFICALILVEMKFGFPTYYYSTIIFMPLGMWFSLIKDKFDAFVMKNNIIWGISFILSLLFSVVFNLLARKAFVFYPVWCSFGMLAVLLFMMKVKINNKIMLWLGKTTIYCFLLQGIPHKLLVLFGLNDMAYYILTIVSTIALILVAERAYKPIERFFKNKV